MNKKWGFLILFIQVNTASLAMNLTDVIKNDNISNQTKLEIITQIINKINCEINQARENCNQGMLEGEDFSDIFKRKINIDKKIEKLIEHKNNMISDAFFYMVFLGNENVNIVRFLFKNGKFDINSRHNLGNLKNITLLQLACIKNNLTYVSFLLKNGALESIYIKDDYSNNVFHFACKYSKVEILDLLLNAFDPEKLDEYINAPNFFGDTPLHKACSENNCFVVYNLLKKGAYKSVNKQNSINQTPLHIVCERSICDNNPNKQYNEVTVIEKLRNIYEIIKLLMQAKSDCTKKNFNHKIPAVTFCSKISSEFISLKNNFFTTADCTFNPNFNPNVETVENYLWNTYNQFIKTIENICDGIQNELFKNFTKHKQNNKLLPNTGSGPKKFNSSINHADQMEIEELLIK